MARADHLLVGRLGGVYSHHGIDCGDGSVIHFSAAGRAAAGRVQRTSMEDFVRDGTVQARDYSEFFARLKAPDQLPRRLQLRLRHELARLIGSDAAVKSFEPDAVIARAESRLGKGGFNLLSYNCEHFATWCKTGIRDSEQVYALWRASLDPRTYWRMRGASLLTSLLDRASSD